MKNRLTECDKCHSRILDGKCDCGVMGDNHTQNTYKDLLEKVILGFDHLCEQKNDEDHILGWDHPSGNCIILFKGDYKLYATVMTNLAYLKKVNNNFTKPLSEVPNEMD